MSAIVHTLASLLTYHLGGDTKFFELLLVVCARLGAVVRDKDELFAWGQLVRRNNAAYQVSVLPLLLSISRVSGTFSYR